MFDKVGQYFKILTGNSLAVTIAIIFGLLLLSLLVNALIREPKKKAISPQLKIAVKEGDKKSQSLVGTGSYNAIVIRPGNILDFTTIPEPVGDVYVADASCPVTGPCFIVRETPDREIVDYDPREVEIVTEETPEYAWFATHWDIVPQIFGTLTNWWQSSSWWFAAGIVIGTFIFYLGVFGG